MGQLNPPRILITVFIVLLLSSCAGVKYTPLEGSMNYPSTDSVKIYWEKPNVMFMEIGIITAESSDYREEELMDMLKKKAMSVGAHGVIMKLPDQRTRTISVPGTTLTPRTTSYRLAAMAIRFHEQLPSPEKKPTASTHPLTPGPSLTPPSPVPAPHFFIVTGTYANIRAGAGEEYALITIVKKGDKSMLLGEIGEWYNIRLDNGQEGWINKKFVK